MLLITSCSSRKLVSTSPRLRADSIQANTLDQYAKQWVERIRAEKNTFFPEQVYAGQGMKAAQEAALERGASLFIISAGLSLVPPGRKIPGYNLTVGPDGPNPLEQTLEKAKGFDWWKALNRAFGWSKPVSKLIRESDSKVLIALPETYLDMVREELTSLSALERKKVRIITSSHTRIESELSEITVRYDQRLNHINDAPRGVNASFVQRALLHFSRLLAENPRISAVKSQQLLIDRALGKSPAPIKERRAKISDDALRELINLLLGEQIISQTRLLNTIRHTHNFACEQHRFNRLFQKILLSRK